MQPTDVRVRSAHLGGGFGAKSVVFPHTYNPTRSAVQNLQVRQQVAALDRPGAGFTRWPETGAHFGLETAMDELAYAVGIDPLELRLRNYTEVDPETGQPFTSRYMRDCYRMAANAFGWSQRSTKPGSTRDGQESVGWGRARLPVRDRRPLPAGQLPGCRVPARKRGRHHHADAQHPRPHNRCGVRRSSNRPQVRAGTGLPGGRRVRPGPRGFGEVPITGVPAAIGNAVFHATGRRIRDLPITQDKLL